MNFYFSSYRTGSKGKDFCSWTLDTPPQPPGDTDGHHVPSRIQTLMLGPLPSCPASLQGGLWGWKGVPVARPCLHGYEMWHNEPGSSPALPQRGGSEAAASWPLPFSSPLPAGQRGGTYGRKKDKGSQNSQFVCYRKCLGSVLGCFCLQGIHLKPTEKGQKLGWG